jgi:hypothetical protein
VSVFPNIDSSSASYSNPQVTTSTSCRCKQIDRGVRQNVYTRLDDLSVSETPVRGHAAVFRGPRGGPPVRGRC